MIESNQLIKVTIQNNPFTDILQDIAKFREEIEMENIEITEAFDLAIEALTKKKGSILRSNVDLLTLMKFKELEIYRMEKSTHEIEMNFKTNLDFDVVCPIAEELINPRKQVEELKKRF